jgi:polygalacturonase
MLASALFAIQLSVALSASATSGPAVTVGDDGSFAVAFGGVPIGEPKLESDCLITAHGAVADNRTVNTKAIQAAIDFCHATFPRSSRVIVPAGAFKTGSLELRSNLELHLENGAGLYGSENWDEYPIVPGLPFGTMFRALISGYNLTNVKVTGSNAVVPASGVPSSDSIIDGVGWSWWCIGQHMPVWPVPYCKHFNPTNKTLKHGLLLPKLVEFFNCSGVEIRNFTAQNSPFWTIVPTYSRDVRVQSMTVLNPRNVGQTDGVDPNSCVNCLVEDCHIDVGDDGVSIKAYNVVGVGPAPCSNVTIRRTNVVSRNICVGGATEGGVSDILFEDVAVGDPDSVTSPWAIKFKVSTGHLRNITFRRIRIGRIGDTPWMYPTRAPGDAFHVDILSRHTAGKPPTQPPPTMEGLSFEDISIVAVKGMGHISGDPADCSIKGLTFRNVTAFDAGSGWGGCSNVDLLSFATQGVVPPLNKCKACKTAQVSASMGLSQRPAEQLTAAANQWTSRLKALRR